MNMQYAICYSKFKERSYSMRMQNYYLNNKTVTLTYNCIHRDYKPLRQ